MVTTLRFSEAIRLGAMLGPQAHGALEKVQPKYRWLGPFSPPVTAYCAMGAAFKAGGVLAVERQLDEDSIGTNFRGEPVTLRAGSTIRVIANPWSDLTWKIVGCPLCPGLTDALDRLIPHLNDDHCWTREAIADWVEQRERERGLWDTPVAVDVPVSVP